jgi:hypothetical protein
MLRYDYDSVLARLKERILQKLDGQNILLFSTNAAWLEAVAEEFDDLSLYDEFLTRENIWNTARGTSSIMKQVGFFDYRPHRKIGSTGVVRVSTSKTFDGNWPYNISIPRFTQFSGGGVTFLAKRQSPLLLTSSYTDIDVIQGEAVTKTVDITQSRFPAPKGASYARVIIEDPDIENSLYEVRVNGQLWSEIDDIRLAVQMVDPANAKIYCVKTLPDYKGVVLSFGNSMFGKSLAWGDSVEFKYLRTRGKEGNILSAGIIATVDSTVFDEVGGRVDLFCTNPFALTGGQSYETLAEIKANAPKSFQTSNRAISSYDYQILINKTGTVDKVMVWGEKEINEDNGDPPGTFVSAAENMVYITGFTIDAATLSGIPITEANKNIIRDFLNDKKGVTDILQFIDTQFVYVDFYPTVWVSDMAYTPEQVRETVHKALVAAYSVNVGIYKKNLYLSDYIREIAQVEGSDHALCTIKFHESLVFASAYEFTTDIGLANVKPGSVSMKIKNDSAGIEWSELARDDGDGNFVGSPIDPSNPDSDHYVLPGAKIGYANGEIGDIIVTFGLDKPYSNYQIKIDFELDEATAGNLILTSRNQMVVYGSDTVDIQYTNGSSEG